MWTYAVVQRILRRALEVNLTFTECHVASASVMNGTKWRNSGDWARLMLTATSTHGDANKLDPRQSHRGFRSINVNQDLDLARNIPSFIRVRYTRMHLAARFALSRPLNSFRKYLAAIYSIKIIWSSSDKWVMPSQKK